MTESRGVLIPACAGITGCCADCWTIDDGTGVCVHAFARTTNDGARSPLRAWLSVTPHDVDGPIPVAPGNGDAFHRATRHIGPVGRHDRRWKPMRPIPGDIISIGVADIARYRLVDIGRCRFAARRPVEEAPRCRKKRPCMGSPVMPGEGRTRNRMRRSNCCRRYCCAWRSPRPGECLVRGKHCHRDAEGTDKSEHSIRHGTHSLAGY